MNLMQDKYLYVLHGLGTEYSLGNLAYYLKKRGMRVLELDLQEIEDPISAIKSVQGQEIIYITSWHLWFDSKNYENVYVPKKTVAPLEIMQYLTPIYSIFYPHDLTCFYHKSEEKWLDLFDLILLPFKNSDYYVLKAKGMPVYDAGWIRMLKNPAYDQDGCRPVYFPSNMSYSFKKYGLEGYADMLEKYIPKNIPIKSCPYTNELQWREIMKEKGYRFLDDELSIFDVMCEHNLIIGNGDSSIIMEASLGGVPVISIMDGFNSDEEYDKNLEELDGVYKLHYFELEDFLSTLEKGEVCLKKGKRKLAPFDFETFGRMMRDAKIMQDKERCS